MKSLIAPFIFLALFETLTAQPSIGLMQYANGFSSPVDIANCGDDRLFIAERGGYIRIIDGAGNAKPQAFLDINSLVINGGGEQGLLGLAFHPDYKNNGYFFVYYTNNNGDQTISRFSVTGNPDIADASSEVIVITVAHPGYSNHNGGNLEFGPDGYLYIGTGDGGGGGDPGDNGQDPLELLGKMLRLDVDTLPYRIPTDNPFYGFASVRNEIWALGLRNPWRFSFDRLTGDLWIGDVGQNAWEEIDYQPANSTGGENYGWRCYEGNNVYTSSSFGCSGNYEFPVFEYSHGSGCSVTGGYIYRGCKYPNLFGNYIFCDYCTGKFWTIQNSGGTFQTTAQLTSGSDYSSFGEDMNGEIYLARLNGTIYRITETTTVPLPSITATPGTSLCPYDSLTLSTQTGYATYDWKLNGSTSAGSGLQITADTAGSYTLTATGSNGCVYTTPATVVADVPAPAPAIAAADSGFCKNDSLQLTTGIFDGYQWSNGSTTSFTFASENGLYDVTVTDSNGCTGVTTPFSVTEHPLPTPAIQQTGYLCNGNSISLSTDSYSSYVWSTLEITQQIVVSEASSYDVTVTDANGCSGASASFTVSDNQLPQPAIYSSNGPAFCEGDSTDLFTAFSAVSYQWSTGDTTDVIRVTDAGDYAVTVTDSNGCTGISDTFEISIYPLPNPVVHPSNAVVCAGDSTRLATDAAFSAYTWATGETGHEIFVNSTGNYDVTVVDGNGCSGSSDTAPVNVVPNPPATSIIQLSGNIHIIYAEDSGYHYQWYADSVILPGDTLQSYDWSGSSALTYHVELTDENGCSTLSNPYYPIYDGIGSAWLGEVMVQPNPFSLEIVLHYMLNRDASLKIRLLSIEGEEITVLLNEKQFAGSHHLVLNTHEYHLSQGIYYLQLQNGVFRRTYKLVKM